MKKTVLFSLLLIVATAISSCKKDRICTCSLSAAAFPGIGFALDTTFSDISKGDAELKCNDLNGEVEFNSIIVEADCNLD